MEDGIRKVGGALFLGDIYDLLNRPILVYMLKVGQVNSSLNKLESLISNPDSILKHLEGSELSDTLVYLAGSLTEGFGNQTSDVDVYVIILKNNKEKTSFSQKIW